MFLREIGTLWQQREGYYTRVKQSKANIIARVLLYVKKENKEQQTWRLWGAQMCYAWLIFNWMRGCSKGAAAVVECWHKHNSKDEEEWFSVTRSFTSVHLVIYSTLAGLLQNKEKLVKTVYQARLSVLIFGNSQKGSKLFQILCAEQKSTSISALLCVRSPCACLLQWILHSMCKCEKFPPSGSE